MAMDYDTIRQTQEVTQDDGVTAETNPACTPPCVALVRVTETARWSSPIRPLPRPNSIFVTHLIATAEQAPQTRSLRRASASDAQAAYTANRQRTAGAGLKARQVA
jgi:hypothetical protein